jgi:hypothetical protein
MRWAGWCSQHQLICAKTLLACWPGAVSDGNCSVGLPCRCHLQHKVMSPAHCMLATVPLHAGGKRYRGAWGPGHSGTSQ